MFKGTRGRSETRPDELEGLGPLCTCDLTHTWEETSRHRHGNGPSHPSRQKRGSSLCRALRGEMAGGTRRYTRLRSRLRGGAGRGGIWGGGGRRPQKTSAGSRSACRVDCDSRRETPQGASGVKIYQQSPTRSPLMRGSEDAYETLRPHTPTPEHSMATFLGNNC